MWGDHLDSWRRVCAAGNLYHIKSTKRERCEMLYFFICISLQKMQRNKNQLSSINMHGCMLFFFVPSRSLVMKKFSSFWLRNLLDELTSCQIKRSPFSLDPGGFISSAAADSGVRRWLDDQTVRVTSSNEKLLFWRTGVKLEGRNFTELQELFDFVVDRQKKLKTAVRLASSCLLSSS